MFKKLCIMFAFFLAISFMWIANSVSIFGANALVSEVYSSYNSSGKITDVKDRPLFSVLVRCGEACYLDSEDDYKKLLDDFNAQIKITEKTENGVSFYAYSPKIDNFVIINGQKINLQIHIKDEVIKVASPIILGSF